VVKSALVSLSHPISTLVERSSTGMPGMPS
jgi:hypothetical protein